jgi:hypothetical protein
MGLPKQRTSEEWGKRMDERRQAGSTRAVSTEVTSQRSAVSVIESAEKRDRIWCPQTHV